VIAIEIRAPRSFDARKIAMTIKGSMNVLKHYKVIESSIDRTAKEAKTFFGNAFEVIRSTTEVYLELRVDLRRACKARSEGRTPAEYLW